MNSDLGTQKDMLATGSLCSADKTETHDTTRINLEGCASDKVLNNCFRNSKKTNIVPIVKKQQLTKLLIKNDQDSS